MPAITGQVGLRVAAAGNFDGRCPGAYFLWQKYIKTRL